MFGNQYHSICCGFSVILFWVELLEGKDRPKYLVKPSYNDNGGDTCGLLLRLTRTMWGSGGELVMDSVFCVLREIIELGKVGCLRQR